MSCRSSAVQVQRFAPTKSQKRILRRMRTLLDPQNTAQQQQRPHSSSSSKHNKKGGAPPYKDSDCTRQQYEFLRASGIIEHLEQTTAKALAQVLAEEQDDNENLNHLDRAVHQHHHPTFKIRPQKSHKRNQQQQQQQVLHSSSVTLTSSICASISGKSKGRIDRSTLSARLVAVLRPNLVGVALSCCGGGCSCPSSAAARGVDAESSSCRAYHRNEKANGDDDDDTTAASYKRHCVEVTTGSGTTTTSSLSVANVDRHAASGHVAVHLTIPEKHLGRCCCCREIISNRNQRRYRRTIAIMTVS